MGARLFDTNSQYIAGSVGVAACPATFACWYQPLNVSTGQETNISCRNLGSGRGARSFGVWSLESSAKIAVQGVNNNGNFFIARGTIMPIAQWNSEIIGSGICVFIAATTTDAGANWNFYWKFVEDADLTNPTSTDNGGVACPGGELYVGAELQGAGPTIGNTCRGKLGQVGVWNIALSQAQLLAYSNGSMISAANAYCAMPMEGTDPETNDGTLGSNVMDVVGDPVFTDISCVPDQAQSIPPGFPTIPKLPNFSGGPGGGLGTPTLSWDDNGPASVSPIVSNARMVQPPDFGSMGIQGMKGRGRSPVLGQKANSMYRGLDHLAAYTRRRKK